MTDSWRVFDELGALSRTAAAIVVECAAEAVRERGRFTLVLSGGSTPRGLYELLARDYREKIDWPRVTLFFGDERCVPPEHRESNYAMARASLLEHVPVPAGKVFRIEAERGADEGARLYESTLRAQFRAPEAGSNGAPFDLVLLGMGADGHTLSLFQGRDFSKDTGRWSASAVAPEAYAVRDRVTLTLDAVAGSRRVLFMIAGADKAQAVASVRQDRGKQRAGLPASRVTCRGETTWLLDQKAAGTP